ncbi:MAG: FKBP-type peptidyl-prolyl cis-trans isomerase [Bacteroidetes bacterium]|nr:FKBP-type peptidyl-prolyl cis-trans isomerase [Bacteroidota bacterium]
MQKIPLILSALAMIILLAACDETDPFSFQDDFSFVPEPYDTLTASREIRPNGLIIYTHEEGSGSFTITERDRVQLFYTFRLSDGTIIQSSYANANTFPSTMNLPATIRGFREGLVGKRNGAKVTLVIPPSLGYGNDRNSPFREEVLFYDILVVQVLE